MWGCSVQASDVLCHGTWRCGVLRGCGCMGHVVVACGAQRCGVVGGWVVGGWLVMWTAVVCHVPLARDVGSGVVMCRAVEGGPRGCGPMARRGAPPPTPQVLQSGGERQNVDFASSSVGIFLDRSNQG